MLQSVSRLLFLTLSLLLLMLAGCAGQGQNQQAGAVIGGLLGGVLGSEVGGGHGRTAAIIAGTMIGAAVGGSVGRSMDEMDRHNMATSLETVRTGVPTRWRNPDTGASYSVVPTRTWEYRGGPCREFTIDALIGGQEERVYGTACRQPDGSWQVQK